MSDSAGADLQKPPAASHLRHDLRLATWAHLFVPQRWFCDGGGNSNASTTDNVAATSNIGVSLPSRHDVGALPGVNLPRKWWIVVVGMISHCLWLDTTAQ